MSGSNRSMVVTAQGRLLTFGRGQNGKLGHGDWGHQAVPKTVEALAGVRVAAVAARAPVAGIAGWTVALNSDPLTSGSPASATHAWTNTQWPTQG